MIFLDPRNMSQMPSIRLLRISHLNKICFIKNNQGSLCLCKLRNAKRSSSSRSLLLIDQIIGWPRIDFWAASDLSPKGMDTSKSRLLLVKNKLLTITKTTFWLMRNLNTLKFTSLCQKNQRRKPPYHQLLIRLWNHLRALKVENQTFTFPSIKTRTSLSR